MSQHSDHNESGKTERPELPKGRLQMIESDEGKSKASVPTMRNPPPPPPKKK